MRHEERVTIEEFTRKFFPSEITNFRMTIDGRVNHATPWSSSSMPPILGDVLADGGFRQCYEIVEDRAIFNEKKFTRLVRDTIENKIRGHAFSSEAQILANLLEVDVKREMVADDFWDATWKYSATKENGDQSGIAKLAILMFAHRRAGCSK